MAIITTIFNIIIALPKIWQMIKEINNSIENYKKQKEEKENADAITQLENAQTSEQIEKAADNYFDIN